MGSCIYRTHYRWCFQRRFWRWSWGRRCAFSRDSDPGQSSGSDYAALFDHNGSRRHLRLAWAMALGATQAVAAGGGCRCLLRRTQFNLRSDNALRIMIGLIGLGFGMQWWIQHLGFMQSVEKEVPGAWHTRCWSMIAGFTSFSVHAGGPSLQIALLPQKLDPKMYAATTVIFFIFVNLIKVFPYYW